MKKPNFSFSFNVNSEINIDSIYFNKSKFTNEE